MKALKTLLATGIVTLGLGPAASADNEIRLDECPPAVARTITDNARGGKIDEIDVISIQGKTLYVAEVDLPRDRDLKIHVAGDGTLLKTREDITLAIVPGAVRDTLESFGGRIDDLEMETAGGTNTFHADIEFSGQPDLEVTVAADGRVIREVEDND